MKTRTKVVALLIMAALLAGPAMAITGCGMKGQTADARCVPKCPMMAKMLETPQVNFKVLPQNSTCCRVAPSRPEPASQLIVPNDGVRVAVPAVEISMALPVRAVTVRSDSAPLPQIAPSQEHLCTFLI